MRLTHCITCDAPMRRTYNYEHCSPACVLVGELSLQIIAHNLLAGGRA